MGKKKVFNKSIDEKVLSDINLLNYFINPSIKKAQDSNKKKEEETHILYIFYLLEIISFLILFVYSLKNITKEGKIALIFYFLLGYICRSKFFHIME